MYLCEVREYMGTLRFSAQYCCEPKSLKDKVDQKQTQGVWQLQLEVFRGNGHGRWPLRAGGTECAVCLQGFTGRRWRL